jgi:hypothetical protein
MTTNKQKKNYYIYFRKPMVILEMLDLLFLLL